MGWFKRKEAYMKTMAFEDHRKMDLVVKRVIYKFDCNGLISFSSLLSYMNDTKWNLYVLLKYFTKELVPYGIVVKLQLPILLTS